MEETQEDDEEESEDEVYYGRETEEWKEKQRRKMEKEERRQAKWGVFARSGERSGAGSPRLRSRQNMATPPPSAENAVTTEGYAYEATTTVMDEKAAIARSGKRGRKGGLKRRWTELVVWCRIGMVRLRRKMGL